MEEQSFIKSVNNLLYERLFNHCTDLHMTVDEHGGSEFQTSLRENILREQTLGLLEWPPKYQSLIRFHPDTQFNIIYITRNMIFPIEPGCAQIFLSKRSGINLLNDGFVPTSIKRFRTLI
jgi:hypothetical protein